MWKDKLKRSKDAPWQSVDGQALILQPRLSRAHELNETASWFWIRFDGEKTLEDLFAGFTAEFDCSEETARKEVTTFVAEMRGLGMIE